MTTSNALSWIVALALFGCSSPEEGQTGGGAASSVGGAGGDAAAGGATDGGANAGGAGGEATGTGGAGGVGGDLHSGVIFACGWEDGDVGQDAFATGQVCTEWGANIDSTHSRSGNAAVRFEIRVGDLCNNNSARAELQITAGNPLIAGTTDFWYAFSTFFPADYASDEVPELFTQVLANDWDDTGHTGLPMGLWITNDQVSLKREWWPDGETQHLQSHDVEPLIKGEWVDWVFHVVPAVDETGLIQIWSRTQYASPGALNEEGYEMKLEVLGPNWMQGFMQPYFKVGAYKWKWNPSEPGPFDPDVRVFWLDEFKIGDSTSSIEDFLIPNPE